MEEIPQILKLSLEDWANETVRLMQNNLKGRKISTTGVLYKSIKSEVLTAAGAEFQGIRLTFRRYGSFIEMSKVRGIQRVEPFTKWLAAKRIPIRQVPGYAGRPSNLPTEKQLQRIAWAIVMSRASSGKKSPRPWYSKLVYARMNGVIREIIDKYSDAAGRITLENL